MEAIRSYILENIITTNLGFLDGIQNRLSSELSSRDIDIDEKIDLLNRELDRHDIKLHNHKRSDLYNKMVGPNKDTFMALKAIASIGRDYTGIMMGATNVYPEDATFDPQINIFYNNRDVSNLLLTPNGVDEFFDNLKKVISHEIIHKKQIKKSDPSYAYDALNNNRGDMSKYFLNPWEMMAFSDTAIKELSNSGLSKHEIIDLLRHDFPNFSPDYGDLEKIGDEKNPEKYMRDLIKREVSKYPIESDTIINFVTMVKNVNQDKWNKIRTYMYRYANELQN